MSYGRIKKKKMKNKKYSNNNDHNDEDGGGENDTHAKQVRILNDGRILRGSEHK